MVVIDAVFVACVLQGLSKTGMQYHWDLRTASSSRGAFTLLVSASDVGGPGALLRLLEPLATHGVNMTRLESRPSQRKKWDYVFFLDLDGHAEDEVLGRALASLKSRASLFRILGSYPRAVL